MSGRGSDILGVLRGTKMVIDAIIQESTNSTSRVLQNSSLKTLAEDRLKDLGKALKDIDPSKVPTTAGKELRELSERLSIVQEGIICYMRAKMDMLPAYNPNPNPKMKLVFFNPAKDPKEVPVSDTVSDNSLENNLTNDRNTQSPKKYSSVKEKIETIAKVNKEIPTIELSDKDKQLLRKLEMEHEQKIKNEIKQNVTNELKDGGKTSSVQKPIIKPLHTLSTHAKARKVPATRIQRMASFGTLGVGLGLGTLAEYTRRTLGLKEQTIGETIDSMFLTKANAERIVSTLCKVRGAALKIGQILSIQDNSIISPELQKAFERVRQSADFMPTWQVERVLSSEFGHDWRQRLATFEEKPFAAASIGQVHHATLHDGRSIALKIQYPGVALGIQSDIENLVGLMKVWKMFPDGMFIDNVVEVAKKELAWEVDYLREAECTKRYRKLIEPYKDYYVPEVVDELSTKQVFALELIQGVPVDKCIEMDTAIRERISSLIMKLCLKELFVFRYMQTDPNWSNFFYNFDTRQLVLLDFGACRSYNKSFMDKYIEVINGASQGDRGKVLTLSREMGFLTGYESKMMENAHIDAVMILGQVFDKNNEYFDFGAQDVTKKIQALVPTIVNHRLCPPPEEIYSLHRKLSGVFLLCAKLNVKINCRDMFRDIYDNYQFG